MMRILYRTTGQSMEHNPVRKINPQVRFEVLKRARLTNGAQSKARQVKVQERVRYATDQ